MSSRARNGKLSARILAPGASVMIADAYEFVQVYRTVDGAETRVAGFNTRIAAGSRTISGRDSPSVKGASSPQYSVMFAPRNSGLKPDDDAWSGASRFRVVSIDPMPHGLQVLLLNLQ